MDIHIEFTKQLPQWIESLYRREARPYSLVNEQIRNFLEETRGDREN